MVSLVDDFPVVQKHKGWQFGYVANNATRHMTCAPLLPPAPAIFYAKSQAIFSLNCCSMHVG